MTEERAKAKLLAWAAGEVGYREGPGNRNRYAAMPEMTKLLGWDAQNQPWCNTFVDAGFITCFGLEPGAAMICQQIGEGSVLCRTSAQRFREAGRWYDAKYVPEAGDVVFFLVGGDINHMGIVTRVSAGTVTTVEGNSSDRVSERCYFKHDPTIAGYGRPQWGLAEDMPAAEPEAPGPAVPEVLPIEGLIVEPPTLRVGMGGPWVAALQGILHAQGYNLGPCGVDGDYGSCTRTAVLNYQTRHGLQADGVVGPRTWAEMLE